MRLGKKEKSIKSILGNRGRIVHFTLKGWLSGALFLLLTGCASTPPNEKEYLAKSGEKLDSIKLLVKSGDLILRNGTDDISLATRKFNRKDTSFSHCGIIQIENNVPMVYHAIGGKFNPSQELKREPLDSFSNPLDFDKIAVYRYNLNNHEQDSLLEIINHYYKERIPFDMFFNFETNDRLYCSEFVFKSFNKSMSGKLDKIIKKQPAPVFISIDDLFLNPHAHLIKKVVF